MTLALSLAQRGVRSRILEARPTLSESGAGIQLGPNATRILAQLGVTEQLADTAVRPEEIVVRDARSGAPITRLPLGGWIAERHGAPYWVTHRRDLQAALHQRLRSEPLVTTKYGFAAEAIAETGETVTVTAADGQTAEGVLLVGADGIWSSVRHVVQPDFDLTFSGMMAVRAVAKIEHLPEAHQDIATGVWLLANAHIVKYPIEGGDTVALVIIAAQAQPDAGWDSPVDVEQLMRALGDLDDDLRVSLAAARAWRRWSLYDPKPMAAWTRGRCALIGDAAHPILPFLAQGGAMAIEDGYVLGQMIADNAGTPPAPIWQAFEAERRQRVGQIQRASRANGRIFHLDGLAAAARNLAMKSAPPTLLMQRYDWVYGWRYDATAGEVEL